METKTFLKILLLGVDFEKFTSIKRRVRPITALQDARLWLVARVVYRDEFLKVNAQQPNFYERLCLHTLYHLCKFPAQIIECIIFVIYDFLQWTLYNTMVVSSVESELSAPPDDISNYFLVISNISFVINYTQKIAFRETKFMCHWHKVI